MLVFDANEREVELIIGGSHPDEIEVEASYTDTGESVASEELDELRSYYCSEIYHEWHSVHGERLEYDWFSRQR